MSDVQGVNVTKYDAGTSDATWIDQGLIKSSLKVWTDVYEAVALAAGQTIGIAQLPAGAVVMGIDLQFDALGAATASVGDENTAALYKSAVDVSAAGSDQGILPDGAQYVIGTNADDGEIWITTAAAPITGTIKSAVYYTN
jgi:hypothetical protein